MKMNKFSQALLYSGALFMLVTPMISNAPMLAQAATTVDSTQIAPVNVDVTVHKGMTLIGKNVGSIVTDGEQHAWAGDTTNYDPIKYGKVGFTAYDISNSVNEADLNDKTIKAISDEIANDPTGNKYVKNAKTKTPEQLIRSGSTTTFKGLTASDSSAAHHVWVIVETTHSKGLITQIAQPIVVPLPLTNKAGNAFQTTSHFYPKNDVTPLTFKLTKHGDSPSGTGATQLLAGIPFQLYQGKAGSGTPLGKVVKTDSNGQLKVEGLVRGEYYFLELPSDKVVDINGDKIGDYLLGANARNDTANKLTFAIGEDGVDPNSLHADVMNYHAPDMKKTLEDDHNSFTKGTLATFKTSIHIPTDINGGQGSEITGESFITEPYGVFEGTDTADPGLTWVRAEADFKATIGSTVLKEGVDYTLTDTGDRGYKIQFIVKNGRVSDTVAANSGKDIALSYKMVVNDDARIDTAEWNTFDLAYQNYPKNVGEQHVRHITKKVEVYTYGAKFVKKSSGIFGSGLAETALQGAKYVVINSAGKYFNGFKDGADADKFNEANWVDSLDKVTAAGELTSGKDGKFEISGLQEGTYTLHEIKAPEGYELANKDQQFKVGKNTYTNDLYVMKDDAKPGLPETGSNEAKVLIGVAIAVTGLAVTVGVYAYKKRQKGLNE